MRAYRRGLERPRSGDNIYVVRIDGVERQALLELLDEARRTMRTSLEFGRYQATHFNATALALIKMYTEMIDALDHPTKVE